MQQRCLIPVEMNAAYSSHCYVSLTSIASIYDSCDKSQIWPGSLESWPRPQTHVLLVPLFSRPVHSHYLWEFKFLYHSIIIHDHSGVYEEVYREAWLKSQDLWNI